VAVDTHSHVAGTLEAEAAEQVASLIFPADSLVNHRTYRHILSGESCL
jgi:hypothetical protein